MTDSGTVKSDPVVLAFTAAADWFVALTVAIPSDLWSAEGLGEWTIRDLVGHTGRALSTVAEYASDTRGKPELLDSVAYYRGMALSGPSSVGLHAAVADRGRQAGAELGDRPANTITALRDSIVSLVGTLDLDSLATSRGGTIRMRDYLPTRTFELVIHCLDLERAITAAGVVAVPEVPFGAMADVLRLLVELAVARGSQFIGELMMLLTGRIGVVAGYSVL